MSFGAVPYHVIYYVSLAHQEASATATTPPLTTPSSATGDVLTRTVTSPATTGTSTTQVNIVGNASDMSGEFTEKVDLDVIKYNNLKNQGLHLKHHILYIESQSIKGVNIIFWEIVYDNRGKFA